MVERLVERLFVDCIIESLTHALVGKELDVVGKRDAADCETGLVQDDEIGIATRRRHGLHAHIGEDMDVAALDGEKCRLGIGNDLEDDAIDFRLAAPVVGIGVENDLVALSVLLEDERTGAHRVVAEVLLVLGDRGGADDAVPYHGEVGRERARDLLEFEDDSIVVGSRVADDGAIGIIDEALDRTGVEDGVGIGLVEQALDRLDVARPVEGRAIVEGHAFAQVERVGEAVRGYVPALGKSRLDVDRARLVLDQAVPPDRTRSGRRLSR